MKTNEEQVREALNIDGPMYNTKYKAEYDELMGQLEAQTAQYNAAVRKVSENDLFTFNQFVLNVEQNQKPLTKFHDEMCRFVTEERKKKKLMLVPRGHLKSTLVTVGYSVHQIVHNPNIRILILNATWQMAVDFLTQIKDQLTKNETLLQLYGNLAENASEWSSDRITLHRSNPNVKGPTVWATGIESNLVGSHPDLIIMDDVVNRENTSTREQVEKVILRYKDALDLLEPGGQFIIIGTRWSEADFYSWILDKENSVKASFNVMIRQAYDGQLMTGEGFKALWPDKFTMEELQTRLKEKGWYEFSSQYLNNPIPDEAATFKRGDFQRYDAEDVRGKEMMKAMLIDPALTVSRESDYTAIVVVGLDKFGALWVLDITRGRWLPTEIIEKIFKLDELWKPNVVAIETIAFQKALAYSLREASAYNHRYLPVKEIKYHERSKEERIKGLQPLYEAKKVYHPRLNKLTPYLEEELAAFPRGRNDDIVDALSFALEVIVPPKPKEKRFHHRYLY